LKNIFLILFLILLINCKKNEKNYKFNNPVKISELDTNDDKKIDTRGFYFEEPNFLRLFFNEMDTNLDGFSDYFLWVGSHTAPKKDSPMREVVKVHEEIDSDFDGKIDEIKWFLPNEFIALVQKDKNKDGYFETTEYYNFKKAPARLEMDTASPDPTNKELLRFDGRSDVFYWQGSGRVEIDDDYDGIPELVTIASSILILEDKIQKLKSATPEEKSKLTDFKKLNVKDSWLLFPNLVPLDQKAIIGSGM
jgi:hypothetical protein